MNLKSTPLRLSILILVVLGVSCLNEWRKKASQEFNNLETGMEYFPAETSDTDGFYYVRVSSKSTLYFSSIFEKMQISGDGYAWKRIVKGVVEQSSPELLEFIEFEPEERYCFIACFNRKTMQKLAELIHEHCASEDSLSELLYRIEEGELFVKVE
ncbi:MAG: hypothetical protein ACI85I_001188 [Arenicella sp.]|jgi:hypothetical protein